MYNFPNKIDLIELKSRKYISSLITCLLGLLLFQPIASGQSIRTEFGKNRVQYHRDFKYNWMYESPNFICFWHGKSRTIAESTVKLAEYDFKEIQRFLEHRMNDKIEILVYADITDLKQSNIGDDEVFLKSAGTTKIQENKMFVSFNGDHHDLRRQIRQGIARIYLNEMLTGSALQEFVQNTIWMQLPDWYAEGLVSFVASPWNEEVDEELRQVFWSETFDDFNSFALKYPRLAGHSLWHYISVKHGNIALSNLLYLTRINRQLESGFIYVLGKSYAEVAAESFSYYEKLFTQQHDLFDAPIPSEWKPYRKKKVPRITQVAISPNGEQLIYVTNEIGRYRVWLRDMKTGDSKIIHRGSFRNPFQETDYNYPQVAWSPEENVLGIIWEKRDVIRFKELNLKTKEEREQILAPDIQRVYNFSYLSKKRILFSASKDGYSDIFIYNPDRRTNEQLTKDFWDDLEPVPYKLNGEPGILFSSNRKSLSLERQRLDSILPSDQYDLYFYPLRSSEEKLIQITNTPDYHERAPVVTGENEFQYLSNSNGIWNRWYSGPDKDGNIAFAPLTNRSLNIRCYDTRAGYSVETTEYLSLPQIYTVPWNGPSEVLSGIPNTPFAKGKVKVKPNNFVEQNAQNEQAEPEEEYLFQSEFPDEIDVKIESDINDSDLGVDILRIPAFTPDNSGSDREVIDFNSARVLAYRKHFKADEIVTKLDNDPLFGGLDSYAGFKKGYEFPPIGILVKTRFKDVFEDYKFEVGLRIPTTFDGTEFFFVYDNVKYQWDKRIAFYRKSQRTKNDDRFELYDETRNTIHIGVLEFKYPLDIFSSFSISTTLRQDRYVFLAENVPSLNAPDDIQQRIGLKLEYVFDNTFDIQPNIKNGTRAKVYVEGVNRFILNFSPWEFKPSEGFMTVIGFDARHYHRLAKHSILALRMAGATTFGSEKILFYMGGVDNWINAEYNEDIPFSPDEDFAYQTSALNMRGFRQNIRNGASYVVMNTELRVPVMKYTTQKKIKSGFLRNLQVIGFFDVGTAWYGASPFSDENPLNSITVTNPIAVINAKYFRDPFVYGYGGGVRSQIFGYFLRFDYGWGVDTKQVLEPRAYFSFGTDF